MATRAYASLDVSIPERSSTVPRSLFPRLSLSSLRCCAAIGLLTSEHRNRITQSKLAGTFVSLCVPVAQDG